MVVLRLKSSVQWKMGALGLKESAWWTALQCLVLGGWGRRGDCQCVSQLLFVQGQKN